VSYTFSRLDSFHNDELLALAATSDTGSDAFRVDRGPDFFALARDFGEATYWGASADGRLIGCIGLTRQKRFLGGRSQDLHYIHDLRVHPAHRRSGVSHGLLHRVRDDCSGRWVFATILDTNGHAPTLTHGGLTLPKARPIGKTVHVGVPLFVPQKGDASRVVCLGAADAWATYASLARAIDFAPADEERFRKGDRAFLGVEVSNVIVAVCKVVDQSASRRFVATKPVTPMSRLLNLTCRLRGRAAFPRPGDALRHAYLAYCVGRPDVDYRSDFMAYLSRSSDHDFTYVFLGLSKTEAATRRSILDVSLTSTTYAYGQAPGALSFSFHELTLI